MFFSHFTRKVMSSLDNLVAIGNKIAADIATTIPAKDAQITALTAENTDLKAQLAAFQNDQATIDGVVQTLTNADEIVAPAAPQ